jgi:hypothetical protein
MFVLPNILLLLLPRTPPPPPPPPPPPSYSSSTTTSSFTSSSCTSRYFVNAAGYSTAPEYASAIVDLKAIHAACCSSAVKTCCDKPFYVKFLSGRYAGRV